MAERHVVGVEHVLDLELPVAVEDVAVHAEIEGECAFRRPIDEIVDVRLDRPDMVLEARTVGGKAREHEAAVFAGARRAAETEVLLAEVGSAALRDGDAGERAVGIEGPAVIEAGHPRRVAAALVDDLGAAMGAAVEEHVDRAVPMAGHHHRLPSELGGEVIAGIGNLAHVPDEQPSPPEDALHLELEDVRVGVDPLVDAAGLDEVGDLCGTSVAHGASLGG